MFGLGTLINVAGVVAGGVIGRFFGRFFPERMQETLEKTCGVSVLFIGIAGAMEGMLHLEGAALASGQSMFVVICLVAGAFIGELLDIERLFERFGAWLKVRTGNSQDNRFVDDFVTASLTVCIGAMAIVGAIQDGIYGDWSILATKAVLDLIIILVMSCSMGVGCVFSAVPVALFEGLMTLLARLIRPLMTDAALFGLSMIGSILIFCVGLNLIWGKKIRVANLLPAMVLAVIMAFRPM